MNISQSLHHHNRATKNSFHSKLLTSKPNSVLSHKRPLVFESNFDRTGTNFQVKSLHVNSKKFPSNFELDSKAPLQNNVIKLNMENHFLILDNLFKTGGLNKAFGFKFSKEEEKKNELSNIKQEKCDVFKIVNNCNLKALENFPKDQQNRMKMTNIDMNNKDMSPRLRDTQKSILAMKKNFFYFEKRKILKKSQDHMLKKNVVISEIYQKYFDRKGVNNLCNLKEFSNYLVKKEDPKNFLVEVDQKERKIFVKNEKIRKLPRLDIVGLRSQRNSFL